MPSKQALERSRRISEAVDNEEWQEFRRSLKGLPTEDKLQHLEQYWEVELHGDGTHLTGFDEHNVGDCNVCVRIDNYIKALCRGGQLHAGETLYTVFDADWKPIIKK